MAAKEYWADVPLEMRARMHYFNVPCDTAPDSPFNPLNIVKNMYRPGDFVVIKLDIDHEQIEQVSTSSSRTRNGAHAERERHQAELTALRGRDLISAHVLCLIQYFQVMLLHLLQVLMEQLGSSMTILNMVAEMYFEQHFDAAEMRPSFGSDLTTKLADVQQLFYAFRRKGLRLHYWP